MGTKMPQIEPLGAGEPRQLGPFRVVGRIGEGGQGIVYLGMNDAGERVAIKLLHVKFSGDATARSRFAREARAAQRVASFCTAGVVAADLEGDTPYIASEYIEGRSLRELVDTGGPLRGGALQRLAVGTATALTAIHHASIVHRDFKPDNVLMAADGPRVVDFGIARILDSTGTITSRAIGTPAYMAPEQIAGDDVGPYTDVFAWGATIAFAATGEMSFAGDSIAVVLNRILNHEVDVSSMPDPLRSVVRSALAKSPAARPSADQILLRLLGHPETAGASPAVLTQGAQVASPEPGEATSVMRFPSHTGTSLPLPGPRDPHTGVSTPSTGHLAGGSTGAQAQYPTRQDGPLGPAWNEPPQERSTPLPHDRPTAYPTPRELPAYGGPSTEVGPPSWQETRPALSEAPSGPPRRARRGRWIAAAVAAALLTGSATAVYATGWRPPFLSGAETTPGPTGGSTPAVLTSVVDRAAATKKLTVGMRDFLPGIALKSNGRWSGFEVDLVTEIAKALGVPESGVTIRATSRDERPRLLADGDLDLVVSTYSINDEDDVTFAGPYYLAHVDVLVKDGSAIRTAAGLEGMRLCQPAGSASVTRVQEAVNDLTLVPVQTYTECMNMLMAGEVDAVPGDDLLLAGFAHREPIRYKVVGLKLTDERYAVALKKGDERGCKAVQAAIADLYQRGVIGDLLDKHFSNVDFASRENALPAMASCG
ncbi:transporter substrate-binding domain-containing protein [Planomonospora sp. ID67723]|uniref:bifunctional serine/threonine-protein kinase/glutamate ABC transporter substrate-binding protein n=1 Tax=Planomonospora sp. ID67723 TaxID=2738134 RepID=UPI0018C36859|nr:bifunctional serine/threonine-protein kinase/glutamate ABC transporter substrate-binding protein [Planomonospora sp. ID67723]MBG0827917.1 transporter substrate-binding domain-containing protein [Planomonospora sp. ID67723]